MDKLIKENGFYSSFCSLGCISWLRNKFNNSFFLVLGTTSCAHFIQTPRPMRVMEEPRCGSIVFDEKEVGFGIDLEKLIFLVKQVIDEYSPEIMFLMGSCFIEIQKIDLNYLAFCLENVFQIKFIPVKVSGFDYSCSYGEDALLSNLVDLCPESQSGRRELVLAGALSANAKKAFRAMLDELAIPFAGFFPGQDRAGMPPLGPETVVAPVNPYLQLTLQKIKRTKGSTIVSSLFPIGPDGSTNFYETICNCFNRDTARIKEKEIQAWELLSKEVELIKDKKIFFMGDNLLELPLARFLSACGAKIVEIGTPFVHSLFHREELERLRQQDIPIVESPNNIRQLERIKNIKPDLVVVPLAWSYPLEEMGFKTLWSVKLFQDETYNYGFENSRLLLKMFTNSLPHQNDEARGRGR